MWHRRGILLGRCVRHGTHRVLSTGPAEPASRAPIPISWTRLLGLGALSAGALAFYYARKQEVQEKKVRSQAVAYGKPNVGGPFQLLSSTGTIVRSEDFLGQYVVLYFGFTNCPDLCPTELTKLTNALVEIEKLDLDGAVVTPVFITVDPKRDRPPVLREYQKKYHPRMVALTGSMPEINAVAKRFRVYFSAPEGDDDNYLVDHSLFAYLIGRDGTVVDIFGRDMTEDDIIEKIVGVVRKDNEASSSAVVDSGDVSAKATADTK